MKAWVDAARFALVDTESPPARVQARHARIRWLQRAAADAWADVAVRHG